MECTCWEMPAYFQKSTKNKYIAKVLEKSNISGFIINSSALTFFIRCGVKFLQELLDHMLLLCSVQISSVAQSCLTLCDPMDWSMPGFPVPHQLPELAQTHYHWVSDAIHHIIPCCPLLLLPSIVVLIVNFIIFLCLLNFVLVYWSS